MISWYAVILLYFIIVYLFNQDFHHKTFILILIMSPDNGNIFNDCYGTVMAKHASHLVMLVLGAIYTSTWKWNVKLKVRGCSVDWEVSVDTRDHDEVIKWKHFSRYWPFVRGIHRSPVNSPHKGQWRGALMFSLICALNKRTVEAGDLRCHRAHYDVIVMC